MEGSSLLKNREVALAALVGLPGSGKTTLCQRLLKHCGNWRVVHVCFDQIIPLEEQEKIALRSMTDDLNSSWKEVRTQILLDVECFVKFLKHKTDNLDLSFNFEECGSDSGSILILLDDNFYYKSMRYKYYQLARKYCLGYFQIYLQSGLSDAIGRASQRPWPIPGQVVERMAAKLEAPSCSWEENTLVFDSPLCREAVASVFKLSRECLENPVSCINDKSDVTKVPCTQSQVHLADLFLRSFISRSVKRAAANGRNKGELAAKLNSTRVQMLDHLRHDVQVVVDLGKDEFEEYLHQEMVRLCTFL